MLWLFVLIVWYENEICVQNFTSPTSIILEPELVPSWSKDKLGETRTELQRLGFVPKCFAPKFTACAFPFDLAKYAPGN